MKTKRLLLGLAGLSAFCCLGLICLLFFGGGYQLELWMTRFDRSVWMQNKTDGHFSPRRPMVKSLMRQLKPGMSREAVERLIGKPNYEMDGWQAYKIGFPRWDPFYMDYDVFEVLYKDGHLVMTRVRST